MGFLNRLRKSDTVARTTVTQRFSVKVPESNATAVQAALERWAQSKGWAAVVTAEREGGYVKLSFEHDESLPGKPPEIDTGELGDELSRVIQDAVKG